LTFDCRFRNVLVKGSVHDDLLAGVCRPGRGSRAAAEKGRSGDHRCHTGGKCCPRPGSHIDAPQNRAEEEVPDDPPDNPDMHSGHAFQCRRASAMGQERLEAYAELQNDIQWLCAPGRGPNEESFIDKVHMGHLRTGTPCAVAIVTGSCERLTRDRPLRAREKREGRLISKRRLRD